MSREYQYTDRNYKKEKKNTEILELTSTITEMKKSLWMFSMAYLSRQNRVSKLLRGRKKKEWRKIGRAKEICKIPPSIPPNWNARKGGKRGRKDI